jgi:alpha-galactosidase
LTAYSADDRDWLAWQYDRPDLGEGLIQVFRRSESPFVSAVFPLRGLDPAATYQFTSFDGEAPHEASGRSFLEEGFPVTLTERPDSAVWVYRRTRPHESRN